jgi:hypothetical protein
VLPLFLFQVGYLPSRREVLRLAKP